MIEELKKKLYLLFSEAGIAVTDNWRFEEGTFPRCMLRLTGARKLKFRDVSTEVITFTLDIFSTYAGEKEILQLVERITDLFENADIPEVMGVSLVQGRILDDKEKGPIMKHGIFNYQFMLATGWEE